MFTVFVQITGSDPWFKTMPVFSLPPIGSTIYPKAGGWLVVDRHEFYEGPALHVVEVSEVNTADWKSDGWVQGWFRRDGVKNNDQTIPSPEGGES